jgi:hypothetical protein
VAIAKSFHDLLTDLRQFDILQSGLGSLGAGRGSINCNGASSSRCSAGVAVWPLGAHAQQRPSPVVGWLGSGTESSERHLLSARSSW